jgi:DNA-binding MarR family transcriptional regulator
MSEGTGSEESRIELMRKLDETFRQVRRKIHSAWNSYNVHGLGMTHGRMLTILDESGPQKASAMAEQLHITSGGVTGIADRLIELGYVQRTRGVEDRRVVMLDITEKGHQAIEVINEVRTQLMHKLFGDMAFSDMEQALLLFERMNVNMELDNVTKS